MFDSRNGNTFPDPYSADTDVLFEGTKRQELEANETLQQVTQTQVQTLYQQQTPHLQSYTRTHLDIRHSTLGYNSKLNIEILERFQSKVLRLTVDAPWYVSNSVIRKDLQIPTAKEEISRFSFLYVVRFHAHNNELIATLTEPPIHKRLRRYWPNGLLTRFYPIFFFL
jgi:hypothetical protein